MACPPRGYHLDPLTGAACGAVVTSCSLHLGKHSHAAQYPEGKQKSTAWSTDKHKGWEWNAVQANPCLLVYPVCTASCASECILF